MAKVLVCVMLENVLPQYVLIVASGSVTSPYVHVVIFITFVFEMLLLNTN